MNTIFDIRDSEYISMCLTGNQLFGDSFTKEEIKKWYEYEEQAYANMVMDEKTYLYDTHELNRFLAFNRLPHGKFHKVLSYGGAFGDELLPVINQIEDITILEPGDIFRKHHLGGKKVTYIKPEPFGKMPFDDNNFDLITCFSALHHIPNVSFVISEMYRVLKQGGYAIIREPITSMGDWSQNRAGCTPCERGIPKSLLEKIILKCGFKILKSHYFDFPLIRILGGKFGKPYNNFFLTRVDYILSNIFRFNNVYYAKNKFQKLRPGAVIFILYK